MAKREEGGREPRSGPEAQACSPTLRSLHVSCADCSLSELCLPRALTPEEVGELDRIVRRGRILQRGEPLYEMGSPFTGLYAVRSGSLKSAMLSPGGDEQVVGFNLPGELVGFDGLGHDRHRCTVVALETTSVCALPGERLDELAESVPGVGREVQRLLGRELVQDQSMLMLLGHGTAEQRLASFLLSLSRRFAARGFSPTSFNLSMSRHDIGNYLGLALETVSRQFARFQEQGIVTVNRRSVEILDPGALRRILGTGEERPGGERAGGQGHAPGRHRG